LPAIVVVGTQWGDEGKGKVTDFLAQRADVVVRYQGGNNAGHTIKNGDDVYKLHFIPSGILNPQILCILGNGMVIDPIGFLEEISELQKLGVNTSNLKVSDRAHLVLPYHKLIDQVNEDMRANNKIGTTRKGIGPAYMDKAARSGLRMVDLLEPDLEMRLRENLLAKRELLAKYESSFDNEAELLEKLIVVAEKLRPFITDTSLLINQALASGKQVVFEGAQGTLLDIDHGTYPFVTASNPVAGGACIGAGVGPTKINGVLGIAKAYSTRVGDGPFPTELSNYIADIVRTKGNEFGTTTGRPRRIGWLDGVIMRYARRVSGITGLCITLLDVLGGLDEIKICTHYTLDGQDIHEFPASISKLQNCKPVYKTLPGWKEDISGCKSWSQLPINAKNYLEEISNLCEVPVSIVSVGPGREQTLILEDVFKG